MHLENTFAVNATPQATWQVLMDVGRWPEWNNSIKKVEWTRGSTVEKGNRVRITQPGLPANRWEVGHVEAGRFFEWETTALGVRTVGGHDVSPLEGGRSLVTLTIDQTGPLAPLVARMLGTKTKRFLQMEGDGLAAWAARGS